ncbi:beta-ketoacyl synthase [Hypoxylon argillaceum]|nr:beta-ketoacyl synthase [Hypoxylon argillaceum]
MTLSRVHSTIPWSQTILSPRLLSLAGSGDEGDLLEPLAIVGLLLKFPQDATSPDEFWKMILEKRCAMTEFPSDRFNIDAFYGLDNSRADTITPRGGHFVKEDLYLFDAPFFSITSVEAASMDVQQRQLQECVNRALENTGMPLESVSGSKTSVDTGSFADDYKLMTMRDHEMMPKYAATGSLISILAKTLLQNLSEIFRTTAIGGAQSTRKKLGGLGRGTPRNK